MMPNAAQVVASNIGAQTNTNNYNLFTRTKYLYGHIKLSMVENPTFFFQNKKCLMTCCFRKYYKQFRYIDAKINIFYQNFLSFFLDITLSLLNFNNLNTSPLKKKIPGYTPD